MESQCTTIKCMGKCSHNPYKLLEMLLTIKTIYERLAKDVCQYAKEIETFQQYYQQFDLNNNTMLTIMKTRLNKLLGLFYVIFLNHLSATMTVTGIGEKIIKPVRSEYGTTTSIRYQNICKLCSDCTGNKKKCHGRDKSFGCKDYLKVQTTINIATYDNISIEKHFDCDDLLGYTITIGKLSYNIDNYDRLELKRIVRIPKTADDCCDLPYTEVLKVTPTAIDSLFLFIDDQIQILGDVEMSLSININYIDRYIKKFQNII